MRLPLRNLTAGGTGAADAFSRGLTFPLGIEGAGSSAAVLVLTEPAGSLKDVLVAYYKAHAPKKLKDVDAVLDKCVSSVSVHGLLASSGLAPPPLHIFCA